jgi:hypothetical protein
LPALPPSTRRSAAHFGQGKEIADPRPHPAALLSGPIHPPLEYARSTRPAGRCRTRVSIRVAGPRVPDPATPCAEFALFAERPLPDHSANTANTANRSRPVLAGAVTASQGLRSTDCLAYRASVVTPTTQSNGGEVPGRATNAAVVGVQGLVVSPAFMTGDAVTDLIGEVFDAARELSWQALRAARPTLHRDRAA